MTKPTNPYAHAYADFLSETAEHQLVVLHDDGLYCHLRIQKPGTRMWSWDITTWPGHLATSGDIADGYMFTREPDMIQFFARNESTRLSSRVFGFLVRGFRALGRPRRRSSHPTSEAVQS